MHTGELKKDDDRTTPGVTLALVGGLGIGAKLRESRCIHITPAGAQFTGEPTREQWLDGMRAMQIFRSSMDLICADFLRKGQELFGEDAVSETLVQLEFDLLDAQRALAIASLAQAVPRDGLTSGHLIVLAEAALTELEQVYWARETVKHRLTAQELRRSIVAGVVIKGSETPALGAGRNTGMASPHGIAQAFALWRKKVDPLSLPKDTQREVFGELQESARTAVALARALGMDLEKELGL